MPTKKPSGSPDWTDPDEAPPLTNEMLADAEIFTGDTYLRRARGRPKSDAAKEQISIRLDPDVLALLRAHGPGWQTQINLLLRQALAMRDRPVTQKARVS